MNILIKVGAEMKKDKIVFDKIMQKEVVGHKRYLLFTRKFEKEIYKFYLVVDIGWSTGEPIYHYKVETPPNIFGYNDYIDFIGGISKSLYRYQPLWIRVACKDALLKRGYRGGGLENNYTDFKVYFKE